MNLVRMFRIKSEKAYELSAYGIMIFFVFYFVQALYYRYYFYDASGFVDWSVYTQAIQLITWNDLNPYLSIRGVRIFNDHFDPIIVPFALTLGKIFSPALVCVSVEIIFFLISAWFIYFYSKKKNYSPSATLLMIAYLLFNKGTVTALFYPSHPTSWSVIAFVCLAIAWMEGRFRWVLLSLLFLFTFKEEFPLVGFMVAIAYAYRRQWRKAAAIFLISFAWFWFTQHRQLFFWGQMIDYSESFWELMKHPLSIFHVTVVKSIDRMTSLIIAIFLCGFPLFYGLKYSKIQWRKISLELIFFSLPLLFIRSIYYGFMMQMTNHYFSQLTNLWGMAMFDAIKKIRFSRYFLSFYFVLLILSQGISFFGTESTLSALVQNWRVNSYVKMMWEGDKNRELKRKRELDQWINYLSAKGDEINIFTALPFAIHFTKNRYVYLRHWSWLGAKNIENVLSGSDEEVRPRKGKDSYLVLVREDVEKENTFIKLFMMKGVTIVDDKNILIIKLQGLN